MQYFTDKDDQWQQTAEAVAAALKQNSNEQTIVLAPDEFLHLFPRVVSYQLVSRFRPDFYDLVVVHKGMCQRLGGRALELWQSDYRIAFANEVFVVFTRNGADQVERDSDHIASLFNLIPSLPSNPLVSDIASVAAEQAKDGEAYIDLRPLTASVDANYQPTKHILVGPSFLRSIYPALLDENEVLKTSIGSADFLVITIHSAADFPYQDLKKVVTETHVAIYSDTFAAVFAHEALGLKASKDGSGFAAVLSAAVSDPDHVFVLKDYRDLVIRKSA